MKRLICDCVADKHIHPDYSFDAEGSIDDYCRAAVGIGLLEICFTPHFDADPARIDHEGYMIIDGRKTALSEDAVRHYMDNVRRAFSEYGQMGLTVSGGLEFGYFPGCEKLISELQSKIELDWNLGAVHSVDDLCLCEKEDAKKLFAKYTLEQLADRYFETLDRCVATGLFNCLAHLDIYRRFGLEYYGEEVMTIHRGRIEKLFETMNKYHVGYELNTSAIRHGHFEYYPHMEIINMARAAGTPLISLGSDAHRPGQLALDFDAAAAVAYELIPYVDE
jgi:histidinol-phosphatase (PHP family)